MRGSVQTLFEVMEFEFLRLYTILITILLNDINDIIRKLSRCVIIYIDSYKKKETIYRLFLMSISISICARKYFYLFTQYYIRNIFIFIKLL